MDAAANMKLIDQNLAYDACGLKIKSDLLTGNAVVLFAYGLSGSGKTFTVFGPDAVDAPEAWFKHKEPHDLWVSDKTNTYSPLLYVVNVYYTGDRDASVGDMGCWLFSMMRLYYDLC